MRCVALLSAALLLVAGSGAEQAGFAVRAEPSPVEPVLLGSTSFTSLESIGPPASIAAYSKGFYVVLLNHDERGGEIDSPILRLDPRGNLIGTVPLPEVPGWDHDRETPFTVTVDADDRLYVSTGPHVYQIDPDRGTGRIYATFPTITRYANKAPVCPARLDREGLCDAIGYSSHTRTEARGLFSAFGPRGELYVADTTYNPHLAHPAQRGQAPSVDPGPRCRLRVVRLVPADL